MDMVIVSACRHAPVIETVLCIFCTVITRAALAMRGYYPSSCVCLSVCLSLCVCVCLSHAGIVSKRLNVKSRKQHHVIAQGL